MNDMLPMLYETVFGIVALFILTKVLGKTQISQLTAFDFIAAIMLGELVGNALFDKKATILDIGYLILIWGIILYIIEMVTQKFKRSRFVLTGKPSIIINEGEIIYEEMRKNKMDLNEIMHLLRKKDVFALQEVEFAILETDGLLSVMKKPQYQSPNKKDMNVKPSETHLAIPLILDGEMVKDNLKEAKVTEEWLVQEVERQGYSSIKHVFYAEWLEGKKLFVLPYREIKGKDMKKKLKKS